MSWEHQHYDTAYAVYLTDGADDNPPPAAVFQREDDAEKWIEAQRQERFEEDADYWVLANPGKGYQNAADFARETGRGAKDYLSDAQILRIHNAYLPVWNSYKDIPEGEGNPCPVPDYAVEDVLRAVDPAADHAAEVLAKIDRDIADSERRTGDLRLMRRAVTG